MKWLGGLKQQVRECAVCYVTTGVATGTYVGAMAREYVHYTSIKFSFPMICLYTSRIKHEYISGIAFSSTIDLEIAKWYITI